MQNDFHPHSSTELLSLIFESDGDNNSFLRHNSDLDHDFTEGADDFCIDHAAYEETNSDFNISSGLAEAAKNNFALPKVKTS